MADVSTCPGCGAEVTYAVQEARVLTGTCPDCARVTTLIEGALSVGTPAADSGESGVSKGAPETASAGPECAECGSTLSVAALPDGAIEVSCAECETVTKFVPEIRGSPSGRRDRGEPDERPARRGGFPDSAAGRNARPCRQCGAPLTFTTDSDGRLTGECNACGNRFTLPPRRDDAGSRGPRGPGRYSSRSFRPYGRGGGGWSSGGRSTGGGSYRRRDARPRRDDDENAEDRPRRRPRRS
jgi:LSD1 subclass zinc finger protein